MSTPEGCYLWQQQSGPLLLWSSWYTQVYRSHSVAGAKVRLPYGQGQVARSCLHPRDKIRQGWEYRNHNCQCAFICPYLSHADLTLRAYNRRDFISSWLRGCFTQPLLRWWPHLQNTTISPWEEPLASTTYPKILLAFSFQSPSPHVSPLGGSMGVPFDKS